MSWGRGGMAYVRFVFACVGGLLCLFLCVCVCGPVRGAVCGGLCLWLYVRVGGGKGGAASSYGWLHAGLSLTRLHATTAPCSTPLQGGGLPRVLEQALHRGGARGGAAAL